MCVSNDFTEWKDKIFSVDARYSFLPVSSLKCHPLLGEAEKHVSPLHCPLCWLPLSLLVWVGELVLMAFLVLFSDWLCYQGVWQSEEGRRTMLILTPWSSQLGDVFPWGLNTPFKAYAWSQKQPGLTAWRDEVTPFWDLEPGTCLCCGKGRAPNYGPNQYLVPSCSLSCTMLNKSRDMPPFCHPCSGGFLSSCP